MEDEDHVSASVVARFPQSDAGLALAIQPDVGIYADSDVHLLLFPADHGITVHASVGEVVKGDVKPVAVRSGIVQLSGSALANLPHRPFGSAPELQVLFAFDTEGNELSIGVSYDGEANLLKASQDCYASIKYSSYTTQAIRLTYKPLIRPLAVGSSSEFGAIAAFRPPRSIVVYEPGLFETFNGNAVYELYKITSRTVSTPAGEFERPKNFPANPGTYTGSAFTLDTSVAMENKRVHEIGYMDQAGKGWPFVIFHSVLQPFVGDNNYTPVKTTELAPIPQFPRDLQLKALDYIASRGLGPRGG